MRHSVYAAQVICPLENRVNVMRKRGCSGRIEDTVRPGSRHADGLVVPGDDAVYSGSVSGHRDHDPSRDDWVSLATYAELGRNGAIRNAVIPTVVIRERID
jgi:hypothetical protein